MVDSVSVNTNPGSFVQTVPQMTVTIVGYGRYGNSYIGPKYAENSIGGVVHAIVDPLITRTNFCQSILGEYSPDTDLFDCFENWNRQYFQKLSKSEQAIHVLEVALKPELVYQQIRQYIEAGVKNLILPKPVVSNESDLVALTNLVKQYQVKACISSQWYYAQLPRLIRRELDRLSQPTHFQPTTPPQIHRAELTISKENGLAYGTDPALLELPHGLQLLTSIGLLDYQIHQPQVTSTSTAVQAHYSPEHAPGGIVISSDVDWHPPEELKQQYPDSWDMQNRLLKIYLSPTSQVPEIMVDFWIKFARDGKYAIRPGCISLTDCGQTATTPIKLQFVEDQLACMNQAIYQSFQQSFERFQSDRNVLTLHRYLDLGQQILKIQSSWRQSRTPSELPSQSRSRSKRALERDRTQNLPLTPIASVNG